MEQAARSISELLIDLAAEGQESRILFLCGPGNNGADGLAAARQLLGHPRFQVTACAPMGLGDPDSLLYLHGNAYRKLGGLLKIGPSCLQAKDIPRPTLIVDALFGVGLSRPLGPELLTWVESLQAEGAPTLAVDCPSGLDCTSGKALGAAVRADWTLSFVAPKTGFQQADGPHSCGQVFVADIGVRSEIAQAWLAHGKRFDAESSDSSS